MGSFSIAHWLIVLVVIMLVFGTRKLASVGTDLGRAIKGFNDGIKGADGCDAQASQPGTDSKSKDGAGAKQAS